MGCCFSSEEDKDQDNKPKRFPPVFLAISKNGGDLGQIVIELFGDVPKTSENFRVLCSGERGRHWTYKGCPFHYIVPGVMCRSGDITHHDGSGGKSIYGEYFKDENFIHKHTGPGILSMGNFGKDTNSSQFQILADKAPWLDGKHVVFGRVIHGLDVVKAIEQCGQPDGLPTSFVLIEDCGHVSFSGVCDGLACKM